MTKLAYLDCPTGIAGDMCLGALVHAGVPLEYLVAQLGKLGLADEYQLSTRLVQRNGQAATKFQVELMKAPRGSEPTDDPGIDPHTTFAESDTPLHSHSHEGYSHDHLHGHSHAISHSHSHHSHSHDHSHDHSHSHSHGHSHSHTSSHTHTQPPTPNPHSHAHPEGTRHLPEIEQLILQAGLPKRAEQWSLAVFRCLAEAEGAVHGIGPEQVHFHEVGAVDAIADIVGTCLGLDWLGIDQVYCSPMPTGGGTIRAAHGRLPVPTPAVLKLWEMRQVPVYSNGIERELVTPTGAAIAVTLATAFGPPPPMILQKVGLGAGSRDFALPNILRLWIGEVSAPGSGKFRHQHASTRATESLSDPALEMPNQEAIAVLETQIDDLNPQAIGYVLEALLAEGAVDVFTQAIGMKKSRPGTLLTVICHPDNVAACEAVLFRETTTLGIRHTLQQRTALEREMQTVQTPYGPARVKVAWHPESGQPSNVQPEYEDCVKLAQQQGLPWREVHREVLQAWYRQNEQPLKSSEPPTGSG